MVAEVAEVPKAGYMADILLSTQKEPTEKLEPFRELFIFFHAAITYLCPVV